MTRALQTIPQEPEEDTSAELYLTGAYFLLPLVQGATRQGVVRPHLRARAARHAGAVPIDYVAAMA